MRPAVEESLSQTVDPLELRRAFGSFPTGVVSVCAMVDGVLTGMVFSSFTAVSLDPPLVLVCVAHDSETWPELRRAAHLGLSVLGTTHAVAARRLSLRKVDRFQGLEVEGTAEGAIFLPDAVAWLDCIIEAEVPGGDHNVVLLRVEQLGSSAGAEPLVFHGSRFHRLYELVR